jgi:ABC-type lipoprotein export system ATPase subunit
MTASILECRDLGFSYSAGSECVLAHLTQVFAPGATTAVTGPSGCGKSTLLYLLSGMLAPTTGQVFYAGRSVSAMRDGSRSALRATQFGFVFQDALLDPALTVLQNVCEVAAFAGVRRAEARRRGRRLLEQFDLGERADRRPGQISGGQAQRVALCRALLAKPAVILADEPTGNLDRASAGAVWQTLQQAASSDGCTVLVATHDPELARSADAVVALP